MNNYFVQVTDKYSHGAAIELHENLSIATAQRIYKACCKAYPASAYSIYTNSVEQKFSDRIGHIVTQKVT